MRTRQTTPQNCSKTGGVSLDGGATRVSPNSSQTLGGKPAMPSARSNGPGRVPCIGRKCPDVTACPSLPCGTRRRLSIVLQFEPIATKRPLCVRGSLRSTQLRHEAIVLPYGHHLQVSFRSWASSSQSAIGRKLLIKRRACCAQRVRPLRLLYGLCMSPIIIPS
jgi:hypothetical protein